MDWVILVCCLVVTYFLKDHSKLLPILVVLPIAAGILKSTHRKKEIFSPHIFFSSFYLLWMGIGYGVGFYHRSVMGWGHPHFSRLAFLILLAYFSWLAGLYFPGIRIFRSPGKVKKRDKVAMETVYNRSMRICIMIMVVGLASSSVFYLGGAFRILLGGAIEMSRVAMTYGRGYLYFLSKSINTVIPIYVATKWYFRKRLDFLDCCLVVFTLFLISLPFSRRPILWFVVTLVILFHYLRRRLTYRKALTYALVVLFLAVVMVQIRFPNREVEVRLLNEIKVHVENIILYLRNLKFIGKQGFNPFLMNIGMLLPGHQIDFGLWLKEKLDMTFFGGGISVTLIGEGMIVHRWVGVVLEAFLIGYVLKLAYRRFNRHFSLRNLFIYVILLYKSAEAINYGIAMVLISTVYEIALAVIIIPAYLYLDRDGHENPAG